MYSEDDKYSHRLSNPDLRCKNKCGFYGNPIYMGYCSKCYKELVRDAPKQAAQSPVKSPSGGATGPLGAFGKFNMKKRVFATAKGQGKLFNKGKPLKVTAGTMGYDMKEKKSKKQRRMSDPFSEFLKTIQKPAAKDIVQHLKTFHKQINDRSAASVDEQSESVQEFYTSMSERLTTHVLFRDMGEEQQEDMMDGIEKHLMTRIYNIVFSPPSCDDAMCDLLLQRKIRMLHWLEPHHLDIPLDLENPEVQDHVSQARQCLWDMDHRKAPQDKLICICKCCQELLTALRISQDGPASADEFVPSLIFILIYTSPQTLHSNINYISRFSNPMRIMSGEAGYYFTNLCGAVSFIENVRAKNLKIPEEEFNVKMGYIDGKTDVDLFLEEGEAEEQEDRERIMVLQSCCIRVKELTDQIQQMIEEADDLEEKMADSRRGLREQVNSILRMPPPRILYQQRQRAGTEAVGGATLPPGRSTLQPLWRGGGGGGGDQEKRGSGERRGKGGEKKGGEDRKGFTLTL